MNYYEPLVADNIYHIFSRAVGNEKLFFHDDDYRLFLEKFDKYISPVADIFSWSLLPNHFHFLIQIKSYPDLLSLIKKTKPSFQEKNDWQERIGALQEARELVLNKYQPLAGAAAFLRRINTSRKSTVILKPVKNTSIKKIKNLLLSVKEKGGFKASY